MYSRLFVVALTLSAALLAQDPVARQTLSTVVPLSIVKASAVDNTGNIYLTGATGRGIIPATSNAFQRNFAGCAGTCSHAFVVKISADGTRILYATYLQGSTGSDQATAIAVDSGGNAYVTGITSSTDLPVSAGAYQTTPSEGFVAKLNADGSALLGLTYVRGAEPAAIAVDAAGNAYVTGTTTLMNPFATTPGVVQTISPGDIDAFVLKLNPRLQTALYSTLLGGASVDWGYGIAVDAQGNAFVTGTTSPDEQFGAGQPRFPVTSGAYSRQHAGADAFVAKLNLDGTRLLASTVIGGPQSDIGVAVVSDTKGDVYVAGMTGSSNFLEAGSIGITYSFAMKLSADFANLLYSTTLPGRTDILGMARFQIAVRGDRLVLRHRSEGPLHTTPGALHPCLVGPGSSTAPVEETYVAELSASGDAIVYATYARNAYGLAADFVYVSSSDANRLLDKAVLEAQPAGTATCVANAANYSEGSIAPGEIVSILGSGIGPETSRTVELDSTGKVATSLGGVMVSVNGRPAPLLYASPSQINAVVPFEIAASGSVSIQVLKDKAPLNTMSAAAVDTMPAGFAIVNPNGAINDGDHPAAPGNVLALFMTGAGLLQPAPETGSIGKAESRIAASVSVSLRAFVAGKAVMIPLAIEYAGDAPGAVQGLVQINARLPDVLPDILPSANSLIDITIGGEVVSMPVRIGPQF